MSVANLLSRATRYLRTETELPCGCTVTDSCLPLFSDSVTEVDTESIEYDVREYRNCTKSKTDLKHWLECDQCGATWATRRSASTRVDFGADNPDADTRLETKHLGNRHIPTQYTEVPIVEDSNE